MEKQLFDRLIAECATLITSDYLEYRKAEELSNGAGMDLLRYLETSVDVNELCDDYPAKVIGIVRKGIKAYVEGADGYAQGDEVGYAVDCISDCVEAYELRDDDDDDDDDEPQDNPQESVVEGIKALYKMLGVKGFVHSGNGFICGGGML